MRVGLADDSLLFREGLARLVTELGFEVAEAPDGSEGVRLAHELRPDAILLDLVMPEVSGERALDTLASHPVTRDIPVIIVTSKPVDDAAREQPVQRSVERDHRGAGHLARLDFLEELRQARAATDDAAFPLVRPRADEPCQIALAR